MNLGRSAITPAIIGLLCVLVGTGYYGRLVIARFIFRCYGHIERIL
jgi:hypothetical protein